MEFLLGDLFGFGFELLAWMCRGVLELFSGRQRVVQENLNTVANGMNGNIEKKWFERPCVKFVVDGVPATLRYGLPGDTGGACADVLFDWKAPFRLRVGPETSFTKVRRWFGFQDLQVNDAGFDDRFLIQGTSESVVHAVLDDSTRRAIVRIAEMAGENQFHVDVGPQGVAIHLGRGIAEDAGVWRAFGEAACDLVRRLRAAAAPGVQLLPAAVESPAGRCPVCAQPAEDAVRRCMRCRTAHHEECWEYFGRCAVYACGSVHGGRHRGKSGRWSAHEGSGKVPA